MQYRAITLKDIVNCKIATNTTDNNTSKVIASKMNNFWDNINRQLSRACRWNSIELSKSFTRELLHHTISLDIILASNFLRGTNVGSTTFNYFLRGSLLETANSFKHCCIVSISTMPLGAEGFKISSIVTQLFRSASSHMTFACFLIKAA